MYKRQDEYIATQAMVWVIVADIFGTGSGDSAARKLCNTAPVSYTHLQRDIEARIEELEKILKNAEVVVEDEVDLDRINICLLYTSRCV